MAEKLLEVKNATKVFRIGSMLRGKRLVAVDDVSFDIEAKKPVIYRLWESLAVENLLSAG